jgi:Arc/MetJ-type ribon-helix-helix transcriptional regulator
VHFGTERAGLNSNRINNHPKLSLTLDFHAFTLKAMEVRLTPDQESFVRQAIESGRIQREEDAVKQALSLWEERERRRLEILVAVEQAEASLARGEGRIITTHEEMLKLAEDIKRRGMARLAAEQNPL